MTLRVAVQMDPLNGIDIAGDSSFALMEAAQARGHSLFHYDVNALAYFVAIHCSTSNSAYRFASPLSLFFNARTCESTPSA